MLAVVAARSTRRGRPIITGCVAIARRPQQQQRRYVQHTADAAVLATTLADSPLLQLPRALFDFTHTATGLPWWLTIPLATLALRVVVTLPSAVYARKQALIYERVAPVTALMAKLGQQRQQVHQQRNAVDVAATTTSQSTSSSAQIRALWRQHGYRPWAGLLLPLLQVPVFVCMSLALRSMCGSRGRGGPSVAVATTTSAADMVDVTLTTDDMIDTMAISAAGAASSDTSWLSSVTSYWTIHSGASPADSYIFHPFTHGGTLWFEDLTACDATMLSPLIIGALHVVNIQLNEGLRRSPAASSYSTTTTTNSLEDANATAERRRERTRFAVRTAFILLAATSVPIATYMPMAINLYWLSSASFSLVQNLALRMYVNQWRRTRRTRQELSF